MQNRAHIEERLTYILEERAPVLARETGCIQRERKFNVLTQLSFFALESLPGYILASGGIDTTLGIPYRFIRGSIKLVYKEGMAAQRSFHRLLLNLNWYTTRHSKTLSQLNISQRALPISIDELITVIQEHFAIELRAYHITVRRWQN